MAGAGEDGAVLGLGQGEDVAAIEAGGNLVPAFAAVGGEEDAAVALVIHDAGEDAMRIFAVGYKSLDLARREALIRLR